MIPEINLNESEKEFKSNDIESNLWPTNIEEIKNSLNTKNDFDYEEFFKSPTLVINISDECLACGS